MALVTGTDVATALGLTETDAMDNAAIAADELLTVYLVPDAVTSEPEPVKRAALNIAIDILQATTAVGGQPVGIEFAPSPFRMGRTLIDAQSGLLGPWLDQAGDLG